MAAAAAVLRESKRCNHHFSVIRNSSTLTTTAKPSHSHHKEHSQNQIYLKPSGAIGSWSVPKNPKEAGAKLAFLRRDYAKQVKELRKEYIQEMELQKQDRLRKDEVRKAEMLRQREERNKSKAAAAQLRAAERKLFDEEFRQTLMKEKTEKLEYWRMREKAIEEKKISKQEHIRKQSSMWIDEGELEDKISNSIIDESQL